MRERSSAMRTAFGCPLLAASLLCTGWILDCRAHGDIEVRLEEATRVIEAEPDDPLAYLRRADLHREHEDWSAVETDIGRARELDPNHPDIPFFEARLLRDQGELELAAHTLSAYLEGGADPRASIPPSDAHTELAHLLGGIGDWSRAGDHFSQAIALADAPSPQLYLDRAAALEEAGEVDWLAQALAGLDEGIERLGTGGVLLGYAIDLELRAGRFDGALALIERRMAEPGYRLPDLVRKAEILEQAGRRDAAAEAYAQAKDALDALPAKVKTSFAARELSSRVESGTERTDPGSGT